MRFTVPQFIEHEAKIVGPLTFKQFVFIGIAAAICFLLFFLAPFSVFIISTVVLGGLSVVFAFLKVGGRPVPEILKYLFTFSSSPKIYLWKKKAGPPPKLIEKPKVPPKEIKETPVPTMVGKSRLKNLSTRIETKT